MRTKLIHIHTALRRAFALPLAATLAATLAFACAAQAADKYWDTNGAAPGSGNANGQWGGTPWSTSPDGDVATTSWTAGDDAFFSAGTDGVGDLTIEPTGSPTVRNLTVEEGNITLGNSSRTLTLSSGNTWTVNSGWSLTVQASIANGGNLFTINNAGTMTTGYLGGSGGLTKTGTGTLRLGTGDYSGLLTVQEGVLEGGVNNINTNGPLGNSANAVTLGSVGKTGTLRYTGTQSSLTLTKPFTMAAGGTGVFEIQAAGATLDISWPGEVSGTGGVTKTGPGTLKLGYTTFSGPLTVQAGKLAQWETISSPTVNISGGTLELQQANRLAAGATVTVSGGTLAIRGETVSTFNMSGGSLTGGNTRTLTAGTYNLSGGTIGANLGAGTLNSSGNVTLPSTVTVGATVVNVTAGTLSLGSSNRLADAATVTVSGGELAMYGNSDTVTSVILTSGSITGSGVLTGTTTHDMRDGSVNARLGGSVGLTKSTAGTVTLSGANTYTGATNVNAGTLIINGSTSATSLVTVADGAAIGGNGTINGSVNIDSGGGVVVDWALYTKQLDVVGTVNLNNADSLALVGTPSQPSTRYVILKATTINGTFDTVTGLGTGTMDYSVPNEIAVISGPSGNSGFAAWQDANSTAGGLNDDHDNDGVDNGVEWFLGGNANTSGFTALPAVTNTGGTLSVTWTKSADYPGNYGTDFRVETSATLANPWTPATVGVGAGFVEITGNNVKFTFPAGVKDFARLVVTGP
jgi:fibronectin-binding autotransporter adhesin